MENNELNKRVLQKLENKISIENFKQESAKKAYKPKIKTWIGMRAASITIIAGLLGGNVLSYATVHEDLFTCVKKLLLDNIGITEEYNKEKIETEIVSENNEIEMTLKEYAIDKENLIIGFNMKLPCPIEFEKETVSHTTISNNNETFDISSSNKCIFNKISDTEYVIYEIYDIDSSQLKEGAKINEQIELYKEFNDVPEKQIGQWSFEIPIDISKIDNTYKEYKLEKNIQLKYKENKYTKPENTDFIPNVTISQVKTSNIATKLVMMVNNYTTEPSYSNTIEILDKDGNIILNKDQEYLMGGVNKSIIFKKIDLNQEITINLYEQTEVEGEYTITAEASEKINLMDYVKEDDEKRKKNKAIFADISFETYATDEEIKQSNDGAIENSFYIPSTEETGHLVEIVRYKNIYNRDLNTLFEDLKLLELAGGYGVNEEYSINETDESGAVIEEHSGISYEEILNYARNGYIDINGKRVYLNDDSKHISKYNNIRNIKIDEIPAISYSMDYGMVESRYLFILNGYVYEIRCESNFNNNKILQEFIDSIKVVKK